MLHDERPISSDNYVGPLLDRDRALGVLAHRQARHSERSGLLLDSAGIGNDQRRVLNEAKRFQITLRWEHERASCVHRLPQPEAVDAGTRPRVQRPDQRQLAADLPENRQRFGEAVMLVDVGRAMQRDEAKTAFGCKECRIQSVVREHRTGRDGMVKTRHQRVDHDIAHEMNPFHGDAFSAQILGRGTLGRVQRVADLVGEQAIDFLRHQAIEAAQSRFNMHDGNRLLHRYQAARQRRIHVPDHDHAARLRRVDDRLESLHDLRRLLGMGSRADVEIDVRRA